MSVTVATGGQSQSLQSLTLLKSQIELMTSGKETDRHTPKPFHRPMSFGLKVTWVSKKSFLKAKLFFIDYVKILNCYSVESQTT